MRGTQVPPCPGLDGVTPPPPCQEKDQHSEHLLHGGRCASCVNAGGLSCLKLQLVYNQLVGKIFLTVSKRVHDGPWYDILRQLNQIQFQFQFSNLVKFMRVCSVQSNSVATVSEKIICTFLVWDSLCVPRIYRTFFQREQYRLVLSPIATVGQETPRHRRQLRFADAEIKLKRDIVYHNLQNGHETSKSNVSAAGLSFTTAYRKPMIHGHFCTVKSDICGYLLNCHLRPLDIQ